MGAETEAALTLAPSPAAQDDKDWVALATTWTEGAVTSLTVLSPVLSPVCALW